MMLLDREESRRRIRRMLEEGWFIVIGDIRCIQKLEWEVYTPGTSENRNFIGVYGFVPVFLARKTSRLRDFLSRHGLSDDELRRLVLVRYYWVSEESCIMDSLFRKDEKEGLNDLVDNVIRLLYADPG